MARARGAPEEKMAAERIGARGALTSKVAHIVLSVKKFRGRARADDAVENVAATTCERQEDQRNGRRRIPPGSCAVQTGTPSPCAESNAPTPSGSKRRLSPRAQLMYRRLVWIPGVVSARATRSRTTA
jgi:hypothetical protein